MKTITARKVIIALRNKIVRNNVSVAVDIDSQSKVIMISGKDANRNIHKIEHDLARVSESYAISFDKAYFDDVCEVWVIGYQEKQMKTVSNFCIGMIKASARGVLNAIEKDTYKSFITKAAKLQLLANKLNINLAEVLPASVIKVIKDLLDKLFMAWEGVNHAICSLAVSFGRKTIASSNMRAIASLVILPKLPALR